MYLFVIFIYRRSWYLVVKENFIQVLLYESKSFIWKKNKKICDFLKISFWDKFKKHSVFFYIYQSAPVDFLTPPKVYGIQTRVQKINKQTNLVYPENYLISTKNTFFDFFSFSKFLLFKNSHSLENKYTKYHEEIKKNNLILVININESVK